MDIKFIRNKLRVCSDKIDKASDEANKEQNQAMTDFVLWLAGYMDGMEHHEHSAMKTMVDTLSKKSS